MSILNKEQHAFGENSCAQCGKCCANILLLKDSEVKNIKDYVKKNNVKLINRNTFLLKEDVNTCPFLDYEDGLAKCNIYPVRPDICRSFSCNPEKNKVMDYTGVKAVNMLLTFSEGTPFTVKSPDLTELNKHIKELQRKLV